MRKTIIKRKINIPEQFIAYVYVKPDEVGYVAICVNLSLFAQGRNLYSALKKLIKQTEGYLSDIANNHPDEWEEYTNRPVPKSIMNEYYKGLDLLKKHQEPKKSLRKVSRQETQLPNLFFVQPVSTSYAQANMQNFESTRV